MTSCSHDSSRAARSGSLAARCARSFALVLTLSSVLSCGVACTSGGRQSIRDAARAAEPETLVTGTVLDGATGEPLSGVRVAGPYDTQAVSGRDGRFELRGLHAKDQGQISARTSDGREASVVVRPLAQAPLDVVLHLRAH